MDIPQTYAATLGGMLLMLLLTRIHQRLKTLASTWILRHLALRNLISRYTLVGPWSRYGVALHATYVTANVCCVAVRTRTVAEAGLRAGHMSLINLIPVLAGGHLSFLSDILFLSVSRIRQIHRAAGLMACAQMVFHVIIGRRSFSLREQGHLFAFIGALSLGVLVLSSHRLMRGFSYEIWLRIHQGLAIVTVYAMWRHIRSMLRRIYILVSLSLFAFTFSAELLCVVRRNKLLSRVSQWPKAIVQRQREGHLIRVDVVLNRTLKVEAGQYINIVFPFVRFPGLLQSHPFMVVSWSPERQARLSLLIDVRKGLTKDLDYHALSGAKPRVAIFSGPHGVPAAVDAYGYLLMIATDLGIATFLSYLRKVLNGYKCRRTFVNRVHVIWQIRSRDFADCLEPEINGIYADDDYSKIVSFAIYARDFEQDQKSENGRFTKLKGKANIPYLVKEQIFLHRPLSGELPTNSSGIPASGAQLAQCSVDNGKCPSGQALTYLRNWERNNRNMLVMVSTTDEQRDEIRVAVREHGNKRVDLWESEYQQCS